MKLSDLGARQWSTYYGSNNADYIYAIDIDKADNIYVTGLNGSNSFLTKYNLSGLLLINNQSVSISFSEIHSIAVDAFGNLYVSGEEPYNYAGVPGFRAICAKFNSSLIYISYDYSSFMIYNIGQSPQDHGYSVTSDPFGNIYWAGSTIYNDMSVHSYNHYDLLLNHSTGFQNTNGGQSDAFLTKIHTNFLRPNGGGENGIGLDNNNNIYTIGTTYWDYYLSKHNSSGVLQWKVTFPRSTISELQTLTVDKQGNVYLTGATYGTTGVALGGHQNSFGGGTYDAFLMKYNTAGTKEWGTYYGSTGYDWGTSVAVDKFGDVILAGFTSSTQSIAYQGHQNTYGGGSYDGFAVKFNSNGTRLWGTYYGGTSYDYCRAVTTDLTGNIYLGGSSTSTNGIASGGFQNAYAGNSDGILVKFNSSGVRIWGTYYGGSNEDRIMSVACDDVGNIVAGINTSSTNGIASGGHQNTYGGGSYDNAVAKFNSSGALLWGTYSGGSGWEELAYPQSLALDAIGNVYLFGSTNSCTGIAYNGIQNHCVPPAGSFLTYMAKYSNSGVGLGATYLNPNASPYAFAVDKSSKLYFPGSNIEIVGNFISPPTSEPSTQPTSFLAPFPTFNTISASYSFAAGSPQGYVAIRKQGSAPSGIPTDGISYAAGQSIGDGVVVYSGSGNNFTDSGLSSGTQYYYTIYSYNGFGPTANYYITSPLTGNATTLALAAEPTSQPTDFAASNITTTSVTISYNPASGSPKYLAVRKMNSTPTWTPTDGESYSSGQTVGDAIVAYVGTATTFNNTNLAPNNYYYYTIFSFNGGGKFSPAPNYLVTSPLSGGFYTNNCPFCRTASELNFKVSWSDNDALITLDKNPKKGELWLLERSIDGLNFSNISAEWVFTDDGKSLAFDSNVKRIERPMLYYRIRSGNDFSEVAELKKEFDETFIAVYPNPGQGKFSVDVPKGSTLAGFELIDATGRVMKRQAVNDSFQMDCSESPQGIYYLKLVFRDQSAKIIKIAISK